MNTPKLEAAINLIQKLSLIPSPQHYPQQAGSAEFMLFNMEYDRLLRSLNAIPIETVREAERIIYRQPVCQ